MNKCVTVTAGVTFSNRSVVLHCSVSEVVTEHYDLKKQGSKFERVHLYYMDLNLIYELQLSVSRLPVAVLIQNSVLVQRH